MQRVKMENGETKYADNLKHNVGEFYENWARGTWHIITSVEESNVNGSSTWLHTMREATNEDLAQRDAEKAVQNDKTADERISETLDDLSLSFPGLDW